MLEKKRKRGRPKGSKNGSKTGRPKGSKSQPPSALAKLQDAVLSDSQGTDKLQSKKARFIAALGATLTSLPACAAVGVSYATVTRWMRDDAEFKAAVEQAREMALDRLEESLYERACHKDTVAAIFLLKGRRSQVYNDRRHTVLTGPGGGPVQVANWLQVVEAALEEKNEKLILRTLGR